MEAGSRLVPRIDQNHFEFYKYAADAVGKSCPRVNGYSYVALDPSPWANLVFDLDFSREGIPADLVSGIVSGSLPNKVAVCPSSRPNDVERLLADAGFVRREFSSGMVLDMPRGASSRDLSAPAGFSLAPLGNTSDFEAFARIAVVNLIGRGHEKEEAQAFASLLRAMDPAMAFGVLGSYRGEPVSTAFAFVDSVGVGGVYFVSTEKAFRGKGFGSATVGAVLDELERRGCVASILSATDLGKPVYERLGFRGACNLGRYFLPKSLDEEARKSSS